MMYTRVILPKQNWEIHLYIDAAPQYARLILQDMENMGVGGAVIRRAYDNLVRKWKKNTGITVSKRKARRSVTVISGQTSLREFLNTYSHELNHLEMHIGKACGYNPYSEEASMLSGDMSSRILSQLFAGSK